MVGEKGGGMIEIEKDIPIPPRNQDKSKYPLDEMVKGDSFAVPAPTDKLLLGRLRSNISNACGRSRDRNNDGRAYATRVLLEDGEHVLRVWRTK